jgi:hypothetical protein
MTDWSDRTLVEAALLPDVGPAEAPGGPAWMGDMAPAQEERNLDTVLERFQAAIDREIADRLSGDDVLEARLARVRRIPRDAEPAETDDLVSHGYLLVRLWLRLALSDERCPIGLQDPALDEIAQETVAWVLTTPEAGPERRAAFLAGCVGHLPVAYQRWRLRADVLDARDLRELVTVGENLVGGLRRCVSDPSRVRKLMRAWAFTDHDIDGTITDTRLALRELGETS